MALFGRQRDIKLFNSLNREIINDISDLKIDIYKPSLSDSKINLYGEATKRVYLSAVRVACLIDLQDPEFTEDELAGFDVNQTVTYYFLKDMLKDDANIVLEVGDVFNWDETYWEVDTVNESDYFLGKNPDTNKDVVGKAIESRFGSSISIICETHLTRRTALSIEQTNTGYSEKYNLPSNL
tara:strand:+ start:1049 stop:1594 length:546 start_codon:yes stop_codon:yes gene_type:complete